MTDSDVLLRLLRTLAAHPVLPPADTLPPNDDALRALLADLARAGGSSRAGTLRAVSADLGVPVDELSRRAQFLLACLLLPASGTHYEVLGVAPDATKQEIRKRWAALIQRYHPDRLGGATAGSGWLDGQARRLIEAYHALKDPALRRAYDAQLAGEPAGLPALVTDRVRKRAIRFVGPTRWKWAPAGIAAVGLVAGAWAFTRPAPEPLPRVPLPAAPKLLDRWGPTSAGTGTPAAPVPQSQGRASGARVRSDEPRPTEPAVPAELPSLKHRLAAVPPAAPSLRSPRETSAASPALPAPASGAPAAAPSPMPPSRAAAPPAAASGPPSAPPLPERSPVAVEPPAPTPTPAPPVAVVARPAEPAPLVPKPAAPAPARPVESASPQKVPQQAAVAASPTPAPRAVAPPDASPPGPAPQGVAAAAPTTAARAGEAAARAETLALIESFRAAYQRKDLEVVMALFGAEARDRNVAGRQAVEQLYVRNFAALDGIRYDLAQLGVKASAGNGDLVVEGRFRIRATHLTGQRRPMDVAGPIRWLLRREGGALRIVAIEYETAAR